MPWYTDHIKTCKVLNRIANRYEHIGIQDIKFILDNATESIWRKQENYYRNASDNRGESGSCSG